MAKDHSVALAQVKPQGGRVQKEDVLAYLSTQPPASPAKPFGRTPASPKARRLAAERGLNLSAISGSGPEGAVLAADVLAAAQPKPSAQEQSLPVSRMWQVMVDRLVQSWQSVPHFYLVREANATQLAAWREKSHQRMSQKITFTDLLVRLVAAALGRHPRLNAKWQAGAIVLNPEINIGLAVAVDEGLVVPVIHQADRLGLQKMADRRRALIKQTQAGKLSPEDLRDGTFTISNLGMYGVDAFSAIVNPPQAAILAVGRVAERVVPVDGRPAVQPMITLTLSCDHRVVDGARAAQFLQTVADFIEEPLRLLD
jgi:pyruvate dehydrogenase E2 component (dihydrolipoamide acetyltransferase)